METAQKTSDEWQTISDQGIKIRQYSSYSDYVAHQARKYQRILSSEGGFSGSRIARFRRRFRRHFALAMPFLDRDAVIVCVGARDGTEVEVWRDLGFSRAVGLDLYPGPGNPFVGKGDFHDLPHAAASVDLIYSNAVDHSPDPQLFFGEASRVLKGGGFALYDIQRRSAAGFEAADWRDPGDVVAVAEAAIGPMVGSADDGDWLSVLLKKA
jgi:hypothetical protein